MRTMTYFNWKKKLHEYMLFCIIQYGLLIMVVTKFSMVFYYKVESDIARIVSLAVWLLVLVAAGIAIRGYNTKFKIIGGLLVGIGTVLQVLYIFNHSLSVLAYKSMILFLVATVIVFAWSIVLFFTLDKEVITVLRRKSSKRGAIYYTLAVTVLTYASTMWLYRYYDSQINAIVTSGTTNRTDGLDAAQVIGLVDAKIAQVDLLQTVLLVVVSVAFIWPYRKWVLASDNKASGRQA